MWKRGRAEVWHTQARCTSSVSVEAAISWQFTASKSLALSEKAMISVGHTNVKSAAVHGMHSVCGSQASWTHQGWTQSFKMDLTTAFHSLEANSYLRPIEQLVKSTRIDICTLLGHSYLSDKRRAPHICRGSRRARWKKCLHPQQLHRKHSSPLSFNSA